MRSNWNQFGDGRQKHGSQVRHAEGVVELNTWREGKREECERKESIWGKFILLLNQNIIRKDRRHTDTRKHTHTRKPRGVQPELFSFSLLGMDQDNSIIIITRTLWSDHVSSSRVCVCVCSWALVCVCDQRCLMHSLNVKLQCHL